MCRPQRQSAAKASRSPGYAMSLPVTVQTGSLEGVYGSEKNVWPLLGQKRAPAAQGGVACRPKVGIAMGEVSGTLAQRPDCRPPRARRSECIPGPKHVVAG